KIFAKPDAAALLEKALRSPNYRCRPIAMGTNTDPYQPVERTHGITRSVIEVLARTNHPLSIVTKSALIRRDIDVLAPMAAKGLVKVGISVTTLDSDLARKMEPRASTPVRRIEAIRELSAVGIPVMVMAAPVIPGLNDHEMERILESAKNAGASEAGFIMLRLPLEVRDVFQEWLASAVPGKAQRVMTLVRAMRRGRDYDAEWGTRMRGTGPIADALQQRFTLASRRLGLNQRDLDLDTSQFCAPAPENSAARKQLALF
ncbi:MAG: PA0069 family radical SAM protein, partial [Rhodobacteraceae bacterium]|nr:PA0069 family radical SAM protein [Paracoccaceae bacterium]